jgi:mRNA interferase RelE/StbE
MSFEIEYDSQPQKFLRKQESNIAKRIVDKIEEVLPDNPVPQNAKSLVDQHSCFRIRIGDWRVLYRINYQENRIIIFKIDKRPRAYG